MMMIIGETALRESIGAGRECGVCPVRFDVFRSCVCLPFVCFVVGLFFVLYCLFVSLSICLFLSLPSPLSLSLSPSLLPPTFLPPSPFSALFLSLSSPLSQTEAKKPAKESDIPINSILAPP